MSLLQRNLGCWLMMTGVLPPQVYTVSTKSTTTEHTDGFHEFKTNLEFTQECEEITEEMHGMAMKL